MSVPLYMQAFHVQKVLLTLTGVWPNKSYGTWYTVYGFLVSLILQALFMMPCVITVFYKSTDMAHGSYFLFCTLTVINYVIKVLNIYFKSNSFDEILNDLEQPLFKYNRERKVFMEKAVVTSKRIRKLIQYPCIVYIVFVAVFPMLENHMQRSLPYDMPINTNSLPASVYFTVYVLQVVATAVCACNTGSLDTMTCSFMALGTAQLQILWQNLQTIADVANRQQSNQAETLQGYGADDESVLKRLKRCARHHIAINTYVEKLEEMFTYIFLLQFVTSGAVICLTGFNLMVIPITNPMFGASATYFFAIIVEISMYCIFGDELMLQFELVQDLLAKYCVLQLQGSTAEYVQALGSGGIDPPLSMHANRSLKISDACYMSEWNNCGPGIRKILLIMMERSKRPLVLTAGKFAALSRQSLVTICKSSFSYFTVLQTLYGNGE